MKHVDPKQLSHEEQNAWLKQIRLFYDEINPHEIQFIDGRMAVLKNGGLHHIAFYSNHCESLFNTLKALENEIGK